jgi:hypothetical protein
MFALNVNMQHIKVIYRMKPYVYWEYAKCTKILITSNSKRTTSLRKHFLGIILGWLHAKNQKKKSHANVLWTAANFRKHAEVGTKNASAFDQFLFCFTAFVFRLNSAGSFLALSVSYLKAIWQQLEVIFVLFLCVPIAE